MTAHHEELLEQAAGVNDLAGSLTSVRHGLNDLDTSLDKCVWGALSLRHINTDFAFHRLRTKIHIPYTSLQTHVTRLQHLQQASDVLRRTARFVVLARRLESQMRDMKKDDNQGGIKDESKTNGHDVTGLGLDVDDGKERSIAKAALSIAELGWSIMCYKHTFHVNDRLLDYSCSP